MEVEIDSDGRIPLKTMQTLVGGWIERCPLEGRGLDGLNLVLNEEGKIFMLPCNPLATGLADLERHGDYIAGVAFICASDGEGWSVGLSREQEDALCQRLGVLGRRPGL